MSRSNNNSRRRTSRKINSRANRYHNTIDNDLTQTSIPAKRSYIDVEVVVSNVTVWRGDSNLSHVVTLDKPSRAEVLHDCIWVRCLGV